MVQPFHPLDSDMFRINRTYTLIEATDYMKMLDEYPTHSTKSIQWYNARTGQPVSIGYTGGNNKKQKYEKRRHYRLLRK